MARWIDSNGEYHNTDNLSYGDQGDVGSANDPQVSQQIQNDNAAAAANGGDNFIDYRLGAGSGNWDRSTGTYFSGDRNNPTNWYGNPSWSYSYPSGGSDVGTTTTRLPDSLSSEQSWLAQAVPGGGQAGVVDASKLNTDNFGNWVDNFDPGDPDRWRYGWGNLLKDAGINPFGNNPYQRYMTQESTYQPFMIRWIVQNALNGTDQNDPNAINRALRDFAAGGLGGLASGADLLKSLRDNFMAYLADSGTAGSKLAGQKLALVQALSNPNTAATYLAALKGSGMSAAQQQANEAWMNMLRNRYEMEGGTPQGGGFAEWFLQNYV